MSLDTDLATMKEYLDSDGQSCSPVQDIASNYRTKLARLSAKKPKEAKVNFRYSKDEEGKDVLHCTFKSNGMFFGYFYIGRCNGTDKWSKTGTYYVRELFGCGMFDYDGGAIHGLAEAKALATLNTRVMLAALQNVTLA